LCTAERCCPLRPHCAQCHDAADRQSRVPGRRVLQLMSFEHVLRTITSGSMEEMTKVRTDEERKAIASFVTGRPSKRGENEVSAVYAKGPLTLAGALDGPRWNGWGADLNNSRFQPAEAARLRPDQVPKLRVKWALGFPGVAS